MKKLLLSIFICFVVIQSFAGFVPKKDAEIVARNHFYEAHNNYDPINKIKAESIQLSCLLNPELDKSNYFYVFNVNYNEGYIIVSSNNSINPILAYSFEGGFNVGNVSPAQQMFLDYYNESIKSAFDNQNSPEESTLGEWNRLLNFTEQYSFKQKTTVGPLLAGINWNQSSPYNLGCPQDSDAPMGYGGHVPVGCVATAMLQVMKYYNWPHTGTGSYFHSSWVNGGYGNYNINFGNQTYDWNSIPLTASGSYNEELAKINLHAGVAVRMWWGPNGSGSSTANIATAMKDYFRYSNAISAKLKTSFTETQWKNMIKGQLNNNKPIVYSGSPSTGAGHAWNCDGYQGDEHFHMNWGWGGSGNGYYTLDNLNSTATPGGDENNFVESQQIIIDIYPSGNYPEFCTGTRTITGTEGSFDDGSSSSNYLQNTNCKYIINPVCGAVVSINFYKFDLAAGDVLKVYDGDETEDLLIAEFTSDNPPSQTITGSRGFLTLRFTSDANQTGKGWGVTYNVTNCKTNILLTSNSGSFDDGSGTCSYSTSTVCSWIIQPEDVDFIKINFEEFDLGHVAAFVKVFKTEQNSSNLVANYSKSNPPSGELKVEDAVAVVQFFSGSGTVGQGWKINYAAGKEDEENNVEDLKWLSNFSIYPNPGNNNSVIIIDTEKTEKMTFSIYNILGEIIASEELNLAAGTNSLQINEVLNTSLKTGVYIININSGHKTYTERFVVAD